MHTYYICTYWVLLVGYDAVRYRTDVMFFQGWYFGVEFFTDRGSITYLDFRCIIFLQ